MSERGKYIQEPKSESYEGVYAGYLWMIGVDPLGIIMCEGLVHPDEIKEGTAFYRIGQNAQNTSRDVYKDLRWYASKRSWYHSGHIHYREALDLHPELVFQTIDEMSGDYEFREIYPNGMVALESYKGPSDYKEYKHIGYRCLAKLDFGSKAPDLENSYYYTISRKSKESGQEIIKDHIYIDHNIYKDISPEWELRAVYKIAFRDAYFTLENYEGVNEKKWGNAYGSSEFMDMYSKEGNDGYEYVLTIYHPRNQNIKMIRKSKR